MDVAVDHVDRRACSSSMSLWDNVGDILRGHLSAQDRINKTLIRMLKYLAGSEENRGT